MVEKTQLDTDVTARTTECISFTVFQWKTSWDENYSIQKMFDTCVRENPIGHATTPNICLSGHARRTWKTWCDTDTPRRGAGTINPN